MELSKLAKDVMGEYEAQIFRTFAEASDETTFSGRQVSREADVPKTTAHRILQKFQAMGLVKGEEHLSVTLFSLNRKHLLYEPLLAFFSLRDKFIEEITESFKEILPSSSTLILFGSLARNDSKADSDIKLFLINKKIINQDELISLEKKIYALEDSLSKRVGNTVSTFITDDATLRKMKTKKDPLLLEVLKDQFHLLGKKIEERLKKP